MSRLRKIFFIIFLWINISCCMSTQRPSRDDDTNNDSNPLFDIASAFIQNAMNNNNNNGGGGAAGLAGVASLIGTLMQAQQTTDGAKSNNNGGLGAVEILSGIGSVLSNLNGGNNNAGGGGGGIDPAMITNIISMFAQNDNTDDSVRKKRETNQQQIPQPQIHNSSNKKNTIKKSDDDEPDSGLNLDSILQIASVFMNSQQQQQTNNKADKSRNSDNNSANLMSLLPMVLNVINTFNGPDGQRTQVKHKEHAYLPPFLEQIHVAWDHFSNSDLANLIYQKSGVDVILKGFTGRDNKLDYNKLFESLHNQSFRRRWIKAATLYLADLLNYIADPTVYQKYFQTGQIMFNGFLKSQNYPKQTYFDSSRPSETITTLLNYIAKIHLNMHVDTRDYVKPAVQYGRELLKLGKSRGLLQKFNSTELSDKLTDTLNLEVIEPVLKVHRAYRFAIDTPQCDKYILCELNSHDPNENLGLAGFKSGITKVGSMASAWFISGETGTPFWTLFGIINDPYNCQVRYPNDCTSFHEGEAKVTTEYIHNEL